MIPYEKTVSWACGASSWRGGGSQVHKERHPPIAWEYSRNYKRMLAIVEEMTNFKMDLIKRDADL